jgi:hypothetical protein
LENRESLENLDSRERLEIRESRERGVKGESQVQEDIGEVRKISLKNL